MALTLLYLGIQIYVLRKQQDKITGKGMRKLCWLMISMQALMLVPYVVEAIVFFGINYYPPYGIPYIICETAIYLIGLLQGTVLFIFLFKIKQVEIEL